MYIQERIHSLCFYGNTAGFYYNPWDLERSPHPSCNCLHWSWQFKGDWKWLSFQGQANNRAWRSMCALERKWLMFLRPEQFINIKENSHFSYYSSVWQSTFEFGGEEKKESILLWRQLFAKWWGGSTLSCLSSFWSVGRRGILAFCSASPPLILQPLEKGESCLFGEKSRKPQQRVVNRF